jgi:hypothetical protein
MYVSRLTFATANVPGYIPCEPDYSDVVWLERDATRPYGNSRTGCRNEAKSHNGNGHVRGVAVLARKSSLLSKSAINFIKSPELQLQRELDRARAADLVQRLTVPPQCAQEIAFYSALRANLSP